jgi:hypothetical protein
MIKRAAVLALIIPFAGPALAEGILLYSPIDCDLTSDGCYIQQYMDLDPSAGVTDYHCQNLSYEGHKGTDFGLPTLKHMETGVRVIASAPGTIAGLRDGMPDTGYTSKTAASVKDRECGNGVVIHHADGWETQYCHLRQGSISVSKGQQINTGDTLGLVGQSGRAAFPHVHLSVRKDGEKIDPFDPDGTLICGTPDDSTLWANAPAYQPGGLLDMGFATAIPEYADIKAGTAAARTIASNAPAFVIYGFTFGTRKDDILRLAITGQTDTIITEDIVFDRNQAQSFRAIGKKRRNSLWPEGIYTGKATLIRNGTTIDSRTITATLR